MLCITDEAGRLYMAGCSELERGWVPQLGGESWLGLMREVEELRVPLAFGRTHADITLSEGGAVATKSVNVGGLRTVASKVVMRPGRHCACFTVVQGSNMMFGVLRPGWGVEGGASAFHVDAHCFYSTGCGSCWPGGRDWEGMQDADPGDRIGSLLDLDQGSRTVWNNDVRLRVLQAEGLRGLLCGAVTLYNSSARIESAPLLADA